MVITKIKHNSLKKDINPIPVTEMTHSIGDHHVNNMNLIPIEQRYQILIYEELKKINAILKERL